MQSVSSRIWTRVAVSISYDDNHYTTSTSIIIIIIIIIIITIIIIVCLFACYASFLLSSHAKP